MDTMTGLVTWWYTAWNVGGWTVFFLLAVVGIAWLIVQSLTRRLPVLGWLLGAMTAALLLIPSVVFGVSNATRMARADLEQTFLYLGLIGGMVPLLVAFGYRIAYQGLRGCPQGHVYDASLSACPHCQAAQPAMEGYGVAPRQEDLRERRYDEVPTVPRGPDRRSPPVTRSKASAWLLEEGINRSHPLNRGDTWIGRGKQNDLVFTDRTVSREHALIREERGQFTIYDRGSTWGTCVNGKRLEGPRRLAPGDLIEMGDTKLRFTTMDRAGESDTIRPGPEQDVTLRFDDTG